MPIKPAGAKEFTLRAVIAAMVVAAVIGASYPYIVMKLGFGPNISVVSAFFGFLALGLLSRSYNRWENNIVQTVASAAGTLSSIIFVLPGLIKVTSQAVPAKKKRFGKDPFTGVERWFDAKPASVRVKARALKKLKESAL